MALAMGLIKEFGIYPPGDLVQLHSGEIAVVMGRGNGGARTPIAATLTGGQQIAAGAPAT